MSSRAGSYSESPGSERGGLPWLVVLAAAAVSAAIATRPILLLAVAAMGAIVFFAMKVVREPLVLVAAFLLALILLPPFYTDALGETPFYVSTLLVPIALVVVLVRLPDFRFRLDPLARGLLIFLLGTGLSLPFGWWLSGTQVGNQSLLRWLMLAQAGLVYLLVRGGARRRETRFERTIVSALLVAAVLTAAYGIIDFAWPLPVPHPAADQFIWLRTSIIRRAQGVFYEAGNFANLCGFFLVLSAAALLAKREREVGVRFPLLLFFCGTLSLAVFVSFTRSAWVSVLVAIVVFTSLARGLKPQRLAILVATLGTPVLLLPFYSQGLWDYLLNARLGNLMQLFADPNLASSGRFDTWNTVVSIVASHPQYLLFGIGYKALPYTRLFHSPIITDNGFLNLIVECGAAGLGAFLYFSWIVFRTFLGIARKGTGAASFWGAFLFSFWCGEWAQMMAVDAYTYWRNWAVFVGMMGLVLNRLERAEPRLIPGFPPQHAEPGFRARRL